MNPHGFVAAMPAVDVAWKNPLTLISAGPLRVLAPGASNRTDACVLSVKLTVTDTACESRIGAWGYARITGAFALG